MEAWEQDTFGWLGKFPPELADARRETVTAWKKLARRAAEVARLPTSTRKIRLAKEIEQRRNEIVAQAKREADG